MVAQLLVEPMIEDGERLLRDLDETGFPITAAFWLYNPEPELWRLAIATPIVKEFGPREAYSRIQEVLSRTTHATKLWDISALSPTNEVLRSIKKQIKPGPAAEGARAYHLTEGLRYFNEAYIYRLN